MRAGRDAGPVGALFSAGCLSVPMRRVRGAPAGASRSYRLLWAGREAQRLGHTQVDFWNGVRSSGAPRAVVCVSGGGLVGWDLLPPCVLVAPLPACHWQGFFIGAAVGLIVSIHFRRPYFVGAALCGPSYLPVRFAGAMGSRIFMLDIYGMVPYTRSNGWAMGLTQANGPQGGKVVG